MLGHPMAGVHSKCSICPFFSRIIFPFAKGKLFPSGLLLKIFFISISTDRAGATDRLGKCIDKQHICSVAYTIFMAYVDNKTNKAKGSSLFFNNDANVIDSKFSSMSCVLCLQYMRRI